MSATPLLSLLCKGLKLGLIIISIIIISLLFIPLAREMTEFQAKRDQMIARIRQEQETQIDLQTEIELIQRSPHYLERIARDRLNLAKPGEVIFRFDPYPTTTALGSR
jgi:cell division protein FtsB